MVELFVGVVVGGLDEHLLRLLSQLVLLVHLDACLELLYIALLGLQVALPSSLQLQLVGHLVVRLRLQVTLRSAHADTIGFGQVARRVWTWLVLQEGVRM